VTDVWPFFTKISVKAPLFQFQQIFFCAGVGWVVKALALAARIGLSFTCIVSPLCNLLAPIRKHLFRVAQSSYALPLVRVRGRPSGLPD
jgi:hypothetical protein